MRNISKEELYQYYITENHSLEEVKIYFKISTTSLYKLLRGYGIKKPWDLVNNRVQNTMKERYGVTNPRHIPEVNEKIKQTNLKKYGSIAASCSKGVKEKIREKLIEANKNPEVLEKRKQTCLEKYGYDNVSKTQEVKDTISEKVSKAWATGKPLEKIKQTNLEKYYPHESRGQQDVREFIQGLGVQVESNNREILKPLEIDIYCPEYSIGIEYNGVYYHNVENKGKNYHRDKARLAEEHGVFLYHVFEYEWRDPIVQEKIKSQLRNLFQKNIMKIGARQTVIQEVKACDSRTFLEENHVQGADSASVRFGLYDKEKQLVALMTFAKPRFSKKYQWELSRFCCKAGVTVNGGSAKLFKYFVENYKPESVVSYSDIAKTTGAMYSHLGFELLHRSDPNYRWCKDDEALTRYQCQRHKLIEKYPEYDGLTETEIMTELGYYKLEDCGNKVWVYKSV